MILVFGGTTEGRKAVDVLEEAATTYYYSTRSEGQQINLLHGIHLTGGMELTEMIDCCKKHHIRLIVDAAHPFAEELHYNLFFLCKHINAPIIRYDRIYPPYDNTLIWCKDYDDAVRQLEDNHIERLLALTGVRTIGRLRAFWENHDNCWFRILNRRASHLVAKANHFPEERLVYYETDDTSALICNLHPQAVITKESGFSGGFTEKVEAARQAGIKIFVIKRPDYPPHTPTSQPTEQRELSSFLEPTVDSQGESQWPSRDGGRQSKNVKIEYVNGPYGLRRAVEKLLPDFFPLHSGLTTGTCATAAAVAATLQLLKKDAQADSSHLTPALSQEEGAPAKPILHSSLFTFHSSLPVEVPVVLPNGETIMVPVGYSDGYAYCIKEAGDDPDVTNGLMIGAVVEHNLKSEKPNSITIEGGEGVGTITLPGFDYPPGEAAINKVPREMIEKNIKAIANWLHSSIKVTIFVPKGAEIASRTFNPRLGIEGGISIIGVSGIVKPFSEEAFIDSIRKCMTVARASGTNRVVINSGGKSERYVKELYPDLPKQAFVEYGNYIGETLKIANELRFEYVTLGVMLGKAVKLAAGHLDTHSRNATMDKRFIRQMLEEAGCDIEISNITLARELWAMIPSDKVHTFARIVIGHCAEHCNPLLPNGILTILIIDDNGRIYEI